MDALKKDFPVYDHNPSLVYLDSAATTLKPREVSDKINAYYTNCGATVHRGLYNLSVKAEAEYEDTREKIAAFINAGKEEIIFTKNTTDSLNIVCQGLKSYLGSGFDVLTTELEHHSSYLPWLNLAKCENCTLNYVPLDEKGRITADNFQKTLTPKTKVVAITMVSNVMGYITPVKAICALAHKIGAIVIVDAAQAVSHVKIDVKDLDCDFLAFSGHKMYGPFGVGILYGKASLLAVLQPTAFGGEMVASVDKTGFVLKKIPYRFEAGTPAVADVIGMTAAINYITRIGFSKILSHERKLTEFLAAELKKRDYIDVYNENPDVGIILFNIKGLNAHDASTFLNQKEICLRAGTHCAELALRYLHIKSALRVSLGIYNTDDDLKKFIAALDDCHSFFKQILRAK